MLARRTTSFLSITRRCFDATVWRRGGRNVRTSAATTALEPVVLGSAMRVGMAVPATPMSTSALAEHTTTCAGCGVVLQSESPTAIGFVPKRQPSSAGVAAPGDDVADATAAVDASAAQFVICQRCHRAKHYGHLVPVTVPYAEFRDNMLAIMSKLDGIVVVVVDVGDVHGTFPVDIVAPAYRGRAEDVIVVANKCDLLPTSVLREHSARLDQWIRTELRKLGMWSSMNLHLVSSSTGAGVKELFAAIKVRRASAVVAESWTPHRQQVGEVCAPADGVLASRFSVKR